MPTATPGGCCWCSPPDTHKQPCELDIDDIDADLVAAFLDHLEHDRTNSIRSRNARLSAVRSMFHFAERRHPEHAATISRVLAMPSKRFETALVTYLTVTEVDALLAAPDTTTWTGRRDRALMLLMVQTGLRISELISLGRNDIHLGTGAHVTCHGKGRKDRITPLTKPTVNAGTLPPTRRPAGLPRRTLIMPTSLARPPPRPAHTPTTSAYPDIGVMELMPTSA